MPNLPTVKGNLANYIDAGFPILYVYTYEEAKADNYIESIAGDTSCWNGTGRTVSSISRLSRC